MNIVEVLSGDWWDGPMRVADDRLMDYESAKVVLHLVYTFCGTHPHFNILPKEEAALRYLADDAGVEWKLPAITSR